MSMFHVTARLRDGRTLSGIINARSYRDARDAVRAADTDSAIVALTIARTY